MEESLSMQKRTKAFMAVAVVAQVLLLSVYSMLSADIDYRHPTLMSELTLRVPSIAITVLILVMSFLLGKKLTGDKRKAVVFMATVYFGRSVVGAVTAFVTCAFDVLNTLGHISPGAFSALSAAVSIIEIPFAVIAAYYAFAAFEGLSPQFYGRSLADSQLTLSRARLRYFAYELIGGLIIGIITSLPTMLISLLTLQEFNDVSTLTVIATKAASAFSGLAGLLLVYVAGYRACKSSVDAMAFVACMALSGAIGGIFTNLVVIPQNLMLNSFVTGGIEGGLKASDVLMTTAATGATVIVALITSIVIPLIMMKYFFSQARITLFSEESISAQADSIENDRA